MLPVPLTMSSVGGSGFDFPSAFFTFPCFIMHMHNLHSYLFMLFLAALHNVQCRAQLTCGYLQNEYGKEGGCEMRYDAVLSPYIDISGYGRCSNLDYNNKTEILVTKGWTWTQHPSPVMLKDASPDEYDFFVGRNLVFWFDRGPEGFFSTTSESINSSAAPISIKLKNPITGTNNMELPPNINATCHFTLDRGSSTRRRRSTNYHAEMLAEFG